MRNRARKRGNGLKHGVFSGTLILSWEKQEEFEKLCAALVEEWQPDGPTEQEAVLSIAMGVWRKRRLARFMNSQLQECRLEPNHRAYDEAFALRVFYPA